MDKKSIYLALFVVFLIVTPIGAETKIFLIKSFEEPEVYRVNMGKKLHIPSEAIFHAYNNSWDDVLGVDQAIVDSYEEINLVTTNDSPMIYFLDEEKKVRLHVKNEEVFLSYGHQWEDVFTISEIEMNVYPETFLISPQENPRIYLIDGDNRKHIQDEKAFILSGFNWHDVIEVNSTEVMAYLEGEPIKAPTITLTASTDKDDYKSKDEIKLDIRLTSTKDLDNIVIKAEGIENNLGYKYFSHTILKNLLANDEGIVAFTGQIPTCSSCSGIELGEHTIHISAVKNELILAESDVALTISE